MIRLLALLLGIGPVSNTAAVRVHYPTLPLEKGERWVYQGSVSWTDVDSAAVESSEITWITEVVEVFHGDEVAAAVVRGFPDELAWYEPGQQPGYSVLLGVGGRLYHVEANSEEEANASARSLASGKQVLPTLDELLLDLPLAVGKRWGGDTGREDGWYYWNVEDLQERRLNVGDIPGSGAVEVFTLAYRTCPDHQVIEYSPGIGILRYVYAHHGTVASANVSLVAFE